MRENRLLLPVGVVVVDEEPLLLGLEISPETRCSPASRRPRRCRGRRREEML
jgi:hypothetical protein